MQLKFKVGQFMVPVDAFHFNERLLLSFGYNKQLIDEIKSMENPKWCQRSDDPEKNFNTQYLPDGIIKGWSIPLTGRNLFVLDYLSGKNPYKRYEETVPIVTPQPRWHKYKKEYMPFMSQQIDMLSHALHRKQCIFACEMGTGKTLSAIELLDRLPMDWEAWYVAPNKPLEAVLLEFDIWGLKHPVKTFTYNALVKTLENWKSGTVPPRILIIDESSKIKTPDAQRSKAVFHLAEAMRSEYGDECYIIEMSGSPAPKSPIDWWHQCEIARPGFLKEGSIFKIRERLAIIDRQENLQGVTFPKLLGWRDNEDRCSNCGKMKSAHDVFDTCAQFVPCINEVAKLYRRMSGLVLVKLKKDCTDLPDKTYRVINCQPSASLLRAAKLVLRKYGNGAVALAYLRELSDGFQYEEVETNQEETCPVCAGTGEYSENDILAECSLCKGTGKVKTKERVATRVSCPKDEVLIETLEQHEDVGRIVIYAAFTDSIDRCADICMKEGFDVIRVDGRGWSYFPSNKMLQYKPMTPAQMLEKFQFSDIPKIAFVGHPGSAGMGLTLTASPTIFYYSNTFNAEDRIQSEDRIHRPGMDVNKGATIIDCTHLPTDAFILSNIRRKKELQNITLGELEQALETSSVDYRDL